MTFTRVYVHLASDEWGNEKMREVAQETIRANPQVDVVTVLEHGGWSLSYCKDGHNVVVVGSANDMAVFTGRAEELRRTLSTAKWDYLPEIFMA